MQKAVGEERAESGKSAIRSSSLHKLGSTLPLGAGQAFQCLLRVPRCAPEPHLL